MTKSMTMRKKRRARMRGKRSMVEQMRKRMTRRERRITKKMRSK